VVEKSGNLKPIAPAFANAIVQLANKHLAGLSF